MLFWILCGEIFPNPKIPISHFLRIIRRYGILNHTLPKICAAQAACPPWRISPQPMVDMAARSCAALWTTRLCLWERLGHNPIRLLQEIGRTRLNQAARDRIISYYMTRSFKKFDAYFTRQTWTQRAHPEFENKPVAYFSWSLACTKRSPFTSGGLGVLSGDHLKKSSDLGLPLIAVGFYVWAGIFFAAHHWKMAGQERS